MDKKISIIIPVYNVENFLEQCIESVISQTYQNLQIILINDGSTDSSLNICKSYALKDERIQVIDQKNVGLSGARNAGIIAAEGIYLMFLDSDDWINKNTCQIAINKAEEENVDLIFWSRIKEFPNKSVREKPIFKSSKLFIDDEIENLHRRTVGLIDFELRNPTRTDAINSAWGKLIRTEIIRKNNICFKRTQDVGSEDVPFIIELLQFVKKAYYLNMFLNHYRKDNPNSLTKNHKNTLWPRFKKLFISVEHILQKFDKPTSFYEALNNRISLSIINCSMSIVSPNNRVGVIQKVKAIKLILIDPIYVKAIKQFDLKKLPSMYRMFFWACQRRLAILVYLFAFFGVKSK